MSRFEEMLKQGKIGEGAITAWLRSKGNFVLPVYQGEGRLYKGPQLFGPDEKEITAPDMLSIRGDETRWVEAKTKRHFTWHRITQEWVTGIDRHQFVDYLRVAIASPWPVWLLFLHLESQPSASDLAYDCPPECPVGLFGNSISFLNNHIHHESEPFDGKSKSGWGKSGMVYWSLNSLCLIATLDELNQVFSS